jgi:hypothetical protein
MVDPAGNAAATDPVICQTPFWKVWLGTTVAGALQDCVDDMCANGDCRGEENSSIGKITPTMASAGRTVCYPGSQRVNSIADISLRQAIASRVQRILELWPKDPLRPNLQLQDVMAKRLAAGSLAPPRATYPDQAARMAAELKQVEALEALSGNKFMHSVGSKDPPWEAGG